MSRDRSRKEKLLYRGDFLDLRSREGWEFVARHRSSGVVAILAVTENEELILVEQYRPPVNARVLEPPAGLVGDVDGQEEEAFEEAAARELEEETGYRAGALSLLFVAPSSAGLTSETIHFYRATSLERVGDGGGDDSEEITVHLVPVREIHDFVARKAAEGVVPDQKLWSVLYFAGRGGGGR